MREACRPGRARRGHRPASAPWPADGETADSECIMESRYSTVTGPLYWIIRPFKQFGQSYRTPPVAAQSGIAAGARTYSPVSTPRDAVCAWRRYGSNGYMAATPCAAAKAVSPGGRSGLTILLSGWSLGDSRGRKHKTFSMKMKEMMHLRQ